MSQPAFLGEGNTPKVHDTRWRILVKIVGTVYNNTTNPNPSYKPRMHDTRWMLLEKWNRLRSSGGGGGGGGDSITTDGGDIITTDDGDIIVTD